MKWFAILPFVLALGCGDDRQSSAVDRPSAGTAALEWTVISAESRLTFVSTKNGHVAEVHQFANLSGTVTTAGEYQLAIPLANVDTDIEIRDDRMREHLFQVDTYPQALLRGTIDRAGIDQLLPGQSLPMTLTGLLQLHALEHPISAELAVTRLENQRLQVVTVSPVILNADQLGLADGVETLRELAGLPTISYAVPVSAQLILEATARK